MTETKCSRDAFRDQLHELSGQTIFLMFLRGILKLSGHIFMKFLECTDEILTVVSLRIIIEIYTYT